MKIIVFLAGIILLQAPRLNCQCYGLDVSNAAYETQINGYYVLLSDITCDGLNIWVQQSSSNGYPLNYILYIQTAGTLTINNKTTTISEGWIIGPNACQSLVYVYARNTGDTFEQYPYNLPNSWQEYDPAIDGFQNNTYLTVICSGALSTGAIIGIVFGCIFGAMILTSLVAIICIKHKASKNRTRASNQNVPPTVVYTTDNSFVQYPYEPTTGRYPPTTLPVYSASAQPYVNYAVPPPPYDPNGKI